MNKKFKIIFILISIAALSVAASACAGNTAFDNYFNQGYTVVVTFDANGGKFVGKEGNQIVDMYNPTKYAADESGKVHIPLIEPTQRKINNELVSLTMAEHFVAGWYTERTIVTNAAGAVLDEDGTELKEIDGKYYYADDELAVPAYTYGGYWDFSSDTIDYALNSGKYELTLYACWVPYYEYNYYMEKADGTWDLVETTSFDYKTSKEKGIQREVIWLPAYVDGAMTYEHAYQVTDAEGKVNTYTYKFPKGKQNTTFEKAYLDPEKTQEITTEKYTHHGSLDLSTGKATDRVQNIYFTAKEGNYYKIDQAYQLMMNVDFTGNYEITADLDFADSAWPSAFLATEFNGKIYSTEGHVYKFKNVSATYISTTSEFGGLFGSLGDDAVVKDIAFENVTFDYANCMQRLRTANFGLFAGYVSDKATVNGVTMSGELTMKLFGQLPFDQASLENLISLSANGGNAATDLKVNSTVKIVVYGKKVGLNYRYGFNPEKVTDHGDGTISLQFGSYTMTEASYEAELVAESAGE